ncbi:alpha/beta hydrolase [Sporosarcina sp. resist]|uniref:alpha/beta hydrolase n=1 Tax=Sporosarcina sp. resist TaxID=2762563 RepID=UPI00164E5570|nr:alpha/beta hydrolase-fold protein [Sporosarcina sp. resist]QNK87483.1 alpha/beta hydrolase [Sporosarcina sp. resist]
MSYTHVVKTIRHPLWENAYRITIAIPKERAPEEGYPVLYVLDGNAYGVLFENVVALQSLHTESTGVSLSVIVSIGYEQEDIFPPQRVYDFTPKSEVVNLPEYPPGAPWPISGGAEHFLEILKEVKEIVRQMLDMNDEQQLIFGHSLGGLLLVQTLVREPQLFSHYYICSPSLWWNQEQVLQEALQISQVECAIFIAVEQEAKHRMYENARSLFCHLESLPLQSVQFHTSPHENHLSIVPTSISQALRFLMNKK